MQLRLRTKLTLVMTGMVLLVAAVLSAVFLGQLLQQVLNETDKRARDLAHLTFDQADHALKDAKDRGWLPESSSPEDVHNYVRYAFEASDSLRAQLLRASVDSPSIYEISIVDGQGIVLVSSDRLETEKFRPRRPPLSQLVQHRLLRQAKILSGPPRLYEYEYPFLINAQPFEVR